MKAVIYLRTSTEEQEPENQKKECLQLAKNRGYEVINIFLEKLSGFKDIERPCYNQVKEMARKGEIQAVIVWALDRWVRNRDTLIEDTTILKSYGCKIHSTKEGWLENINIEGSIGKTVSEFLLGLMGSLAQVESERKSERVKLAVRIKDGVKVSYKGNKWGFHGLPEETNNQIIELSKLGKSLRQISKEVRYFDKNRNEKFVSLGYVHKILKQFNEKNSNRLNEVQELTNL